MYYFSSNILLGRPAHTNMDLPLDIIFSITIKSSHHFLFTRRVICLYVTVMRNSLNLYINHTVMFILVTWNWSKMSLYVTSWKWELNLEKRHPVTKINWPLYTEMLLNSSQKKVARSTKSKFIIFDSWKQNIIQEIDKVLKSLPITFVSPFIMDQPEVRQYINYLHDRFVIVPVDKAGINFGIVCKSFYLDVIKNELGISDDGNIIGNTVYKPIYQKVNDIYTFHEEKLLSTFGMKLLDINHYIPLLYWTSKQHKCPYKFRFIAGASKCYNKQLAIELSLALKCIKKHFKNYCKVIQKRTGISYYWSIDNSHEFIKNIADIKTAHSIKTYDFSTLYTNLPLDVIYDSLRSLIIKMFVNSKSVAIMVNSNSKRAFWSNGSNYAGYREYTIDKLLEALELILFNTYIQFNGSIFKQILGIPMGGNASPFIADLYLSWCEYCYMTKVVKTDYTLAKLLSYNCRYLDDICTINLQNFGDIAKDIYDNTLLLEGSTCSYKQDTFLDLYIRVVDHKFITGIYHKVDDFNFEVISYPFPQSNVHSMLGYSTYYSQLIRFFRLCNNINDFLFRAKFSYSKLVKRGYKHNLLLKYFKKFCSAYNVEGKYGEKNSDLLFSRMLKHNPFVSYNINNTKEINDIVKASCVKIMPLTRSVECEWLNKSPLPTNVSDTVNAPLPYTLDIDESGGNNSCSLSDVAECSIILDKNTPPRNFYLITIPFIRQ